MRDGGGGHWGVRDESQVSQVVRVVFDVTALMGLEWVLDILRHLLFSLIGSLPTYLSHSSMHPCGGLLLDYY